jgi:hypothetical protein
MRARTARIWAATRAACASSIKVAVPVGNQVGDEASMRSATQAGAHSSLSRRQPVGTSRRSIIHAPLSSSLPALLHTTIRSSGASSVMMLRVSLFWLPSRSRDAGRRSGADATRSIAPRLSDPRSTTETASCLTHCKVVGTLPCQHTLPSMECPSAISALPSGEMSR